MWATAIYDLGLTSETFWHLTPPQMAYLVHRKELSEIQTDSRFGMIVSTIIAVVTGKKGQVPSALEVMGYEEEGEGVTSKQANPAVAQQEIALRFRLLAAAQRIAGQKPR